MLDIVIQEIIDAVDAEQPTQIYVAPDRFGFIRDGQNYQKGLHGFREWWVVEICLRYLKKEGIIKEFINLSIHNYCDYVEITPVRRKTNGSKNEGY